MRGSSMTFYPAKGPWPPSCRLAAIRSVGRWIFLNRRAGSHRGSMGNGEESRNQGYAATKGRNPTASRSFLPNLSENFLLGCSSSLTSCEDSSTDAATS